MIELSAFVFENLSADEVEEVRWLLLSDGSQEFAESLHPASRRIEIAPQKTKNNAANEMGELEDDCVLVVTKIARLHNPLPRLRFVPDGQRWMSEKGVTDRLPQNRSVDKVLRVQHRKKRGSNSR